MRLTRIVHMGNYSSQSDFFQTSLECRRLKPGPAGNNLILISLLPFDSRWTMGIKDDGFTIRMGIIGPRYSHPIVKYDDELLPDRSLGLFGWVDWPASGIPFEYLPDSNDYLPLRIPHFWILMHIQRYIEPLNPKIPDHPQLSTHHPLTTHQLSRWARITHTNSIQNPSRTIHHPLKSSEYPSAISIRLVSFHVWLRIDDRY